MATEEHPPQDDPSCEQARAAIGRFLSMGFKIGDDAEAQDAMRQHIQGCDACAEAYRSGVETTSSMKAALLASRQRELRSKMGGRPRLGGMGAMGVLMSWGGKEPSSKLVATIWRLRPVLIVAFFFWLMVTLTKPGGPGPAFRVDWRGGLVVLDGKQLIDDGPNFGLKQSQNVATNFEGTARVHRAATEVLLSPATEVECERIEPARMRLYHGTLAITGPLELTSDHGFLSQAEGHSRVTLEPAGLRVQCFEGGLTATLPEVEHLLGPGDTLLVDRQGVRLLPGSVVTNPSSGD
ncbi:MAG: hypothetical protein P1V81_15090 [Planctomycetota bacterium]|nr:hypothetical protein [Planctomycetota bacterium]